MVPIVATAASVGVIADIAGVGSVAGTAEAVPIAVAALIELIVAPA